MIDVYGAVVSIDIMGTQTAIAERIVNTEGNYVSGLKQNQPTLYENVKKYFDWAREDECEKRIYLWKSTMIADMDGLPTAVWKMPLLTFFFLLAFILVLV